MNDFLEAEIEDGQAEVAYFSVVEKKLLKSPAHVLTKHNRKAYSVPVY